MRKEKENNVEHSTYYQVVLHHRNALMTQVFVAEKNLVACSTWEGEQTVWLRVHFMFSAPTWTCGWRGRRLVREHYQTAERNVFPSLVLNVAQFLMRWSTSIHSPSKLHVLRCIICTLFKTLPLFFCKFSFCIRTICQLV